MSYCYVHLSREKDIFFFFYFILRQITPYNSIKDNLYLCCLVCGSSNISSVKNLKSRTQFDKIIRFHKLKAGKVIM